MLDGTLNALAAARGAFAYRDFQARPDDPPPLLPVTSSREREAWREKLSVAAGALDEAQSMSLLAAWGVPVITHALAASPDELRRAGAKLDYPVALKTAEPGILHKSDTGGVRLGLASEAALLDAYGDLARRLGPRVLIAPMAGPGVEIALGMLRDPQFGPMVVIGAGGTLVEFLEDRSAALAPFGRTTARRLVESLKLEQLLRGYRGSAPVDLGALSEAIARFSVLAADLADIVAEIDVNPLLAGKDILALDALVIVKPETS